MHFCSQMKFTLKPNILENSWYWKLVYCYSTMLRLIATKIPSYQEKMQEILKIALKLHYWETADQNKFHVFFWVFGSHLNESLIIKLFTDMQRMSKLFYTVQFYLLK